MYNTHIIRTVCTVNHRLDLRRNHSMHKQIAALLLSNYGTSILGLSIILYTVRTYSVRVRRQVILYIQNIIIQSCTTYVHNITIQSCTTYGHNIMNQSCTTYGHNIMNQSCTTWPNSKFNWQCITEVQTLKTIYVHFTAPNSACKYYSRTTQI